MPITILLVASLLLGGITTATFNCERYSPRMSFCKSNLEKATQVAAEAAKAAKAALDAQTDAGEAASQQVKLMLSERAQQAAKAATQVLAGKKHQLDILAKRLDENRKAIEEGKRAIAATICTLKRSLWIRDNTRQGLKNMIRMYKESRSTRADIKYLAAFAQQEEAEKKKLLQTALRRLVELKKCMKQAQAELKKIRESVKKANCAAVEARQRSDLLRKLVPKIKKLKREDLKTVKDFLLKRRRSHIRN
ncbi:hypothetical protein KR059_005647 [Drosophila kikkawai]|nr:hypothetical protein KR059_005647 [Drosophila kikkawai]